MDDAKSDDNPSSSSSSSSPQISRTLKVTKSGRDITVSSAAASAAEAARDASAAAKERHARCADARAEAEENVRRVELKVFEDTRNSADELRLAEADVQECELALERARQRLEKAHETKKRVALECPKMVKEAWEELEKRRKEESAAADLQAEAEKKEEEAVYAMSQAAAAEVAAAKVRREEARLKREHDAELLEEQLAEEQEKLHPRLWSPSQVGNFIDEFSLPNKVEVRARWETAAKEADGRWKKLMDSEFLKKRDEVESLLIDLGITNGFHRLRVHRRISEIVEGAKDVEKHSDASGTRFGTSARLGASPKRKKTRHSPFRKERSKTKESKRMSLNVARGLAAKQAIERATFSIAERIEAHDRPRTLRYSMKALQELDENPEKGILKNATNAIDWKRKGKGLRLRRSSSAKELNESQKRGGENRANAFDAFRSSQFMKRAQTMDPTAMKQFIRKRNTPPRSDKSRMNGGGKKHGLPPSPPTSSNSARPRRRARSASVGGNADATVPAKGTAMLKRPPTQGELDAMQKREKMLAKRSKVALEIFGTERAYVANIRMVVDLFIQPLKNAQGTILSRRKMAKIFHGIEHIVTVNKQFLDDLTKTMLLWNDQSELGALFISFAPYFKMYMRYINNFSLCAKDLADFSRRKKRFSNFLEKVHQDPRLKGQRLTDLLIQPVQRIPRYRLLVAELLHRTPEDHDDHPKLVKALKQIEETANAVNESVKRSDALRKQMEESMAAVAKAEEEARLLREAEMGGRQTLAHRFGAVFDVHDRDDDEDEELDDDESNKNSTKNGRYSVRDSIRGFVGDISSLAANLFRGDEAQNRSVDDDDNELTIEVGPGAKRPVSTVTGKTFGSAAPRGITADLRKAAPTKDEAAGFVSGSASFDAFKTDKFGFKVLRRFEFNKRQGTLTTFDGSEIGKVFKAKNIPVIIPTNPKKGICKVIFDTSLEQRPYVLTFPIVENMTRFVEAWKLTREAELAPGLDGLAGSRPRRRTVAIRDNSNSPTKSRHRKPLETVEEETAVENISSPKRSPKRREVKFKVEARHSPERRNVNGKKKGKKKRRPASEVYAPPSSRAPMLPQTAPPSRRGGLRSRAQPPIPSKLNRRVPKIPNKTKSRLSRKRASPFKGKSLASEALGK